MRDIMDCDFCGVSFEFGEFPHDPSEQKAQALADVMRGRNTKFGTMLAVTFRPSRVLRFRVCTDCAENPAVRSAIERLAELASHLSYAREDRRLFDMSQPRSTFGPVNDPECRYGSFSLTKELPDDVDPSRVP